MNNKINNLMVDPMIQIKKKYKTLNYILIFTFLACSWSINYTYSTLGNKKELIRLAVLENNFVKIPSNIDKIKFKEAYKDDPIKLIYDPNYLYIGKVNGKINQITLFIEFNPFSQKCEMNSRVSGIWRFLDYFSNSGPFYLNINSFEIDTDYCNFAP